MLCEPPGLAHWADLQVLVGGVIVGKLFMFQIESDLTAESNRNVSDVA